MKLLHGNIESVGVKSCSVRLKTGQLLQDVPYLTSLDEDGREEQIKIKVGLEVGLLVGEYGHAYIVGSSNIAIDVLEKVKRIEQETILMRAKELLISSSSNFDEVNSPKTRMDLLEALSEHTTFKSTYFDIKKEDGELSERVQFETKKFAVKNDSDEIIDLLIKGLEEFINFLKSVQNQKTLVAKGSSAGEWSHNQVGVVSGLISVVTDIKTRLGAFKV